MMRLLILALLVVLGCKKPTKQSTVSNSDGVSSDFDTIRHDALNDSEKLANHLLTQKIFDGVETRFRAQNSRTQKLVDLKNSGSQDYTDYREAVKYMMDFMISPIEVLSVVQPGTSSANHLVGDQAWEPTRFAPLEVILMGLWDTYACQMENSTYERNGKNCAQLLEMYNGDGFDFYGSMSIPRLACLKNLETYETKSEYFKDKNLKHVAIQDSLREALVDLGKSVEAQFAPTMAHSDYKMQYECGDGGNPFMGRYLNDDGRMARINVSVIGKYILPFAANFLGDIHLWYLVPDNLFGDFDDLEAPGAHEALQKMVEWVQNHGNIMWKILHILQSRNLITANDVQSSSFEGILEKLESQTNPVGINPNSQDVINAAASSSSMDLSEVTATAQDYLLLRPTQESVRDYKIENTENNISIIKVAAETAITSEIEIMPELISRADAVHDCETGIQAFTRDLFGDDNEILLSRYVSNKVFGNGEINIDDSIFNALQNLNRETNCIYEYITTYTEIDSDRRYDEMFKKMSHFATSPQIAAEVIGAFSINTPDDIHSQILGKTADQPSHEIMNSGPSGKLCPGELVPQHYCGSALGRMFFVQALENRAIQRLKVLTGVSAMVSMASAGVNAGIGYFGVTALARIVPYLAITGQISALASVGFQLGYIVKEYQRQKMATINYYLTLSPDDYIYAIKKRKDLLNEVRSMLVFDAGTGVALPFAVQAMHKFLPAVRNTAPTTKQPAMLSHGIRDAVERSGSFEGIDSVMVDRLAAGNYWQTDLNKFVDKLVEHFDNKTQYYFYESNTRSYVPLNDPSFSERPFVNRNIDDLARTPLGRRLVANATHEGKLAIVETNVSRGSRGGVGRLDDWTIEYSFRGDILNRKDAASIFQVLSGHELVHVWDFKYLSAVHQSNELRLTDIDILLGLAEYPDDLDDFYRSIDPNLFKPYVGQTELEKLRMLSKSRKEKTFKKLSEWGEGDLYIMLSIMYSRVKMEMRAIASNLVVAKQLDLSAADYDLFLADLKHSSPQRYEIELSLYKEILETADEGEVFVRRVEDLAKMYFIDQSDLIAMLDDLDFFDYIGEIIPLWQIDPTNYRGFFDLRSQPVPLPSDSHAIANPLNTPMVESFILPPVDFISNQLTCNAWPLQDSGCGHPVCAGAPQDGLVLFLPFPNAQISGVNLSSQLSSDGWVKHGEDERDGSCFYLQDISSLATFIKPAPVPSGEHKVYLPYVLNRSQVSDGISSPKLARNSASIKNTWAESDVGARESVAMRTSETEELSSQSFACFNDGKLRFPVIGGQGQTIEVDCDCKILEYREKNYSMCNGG